MRVWSNQGSDDGSIHAIGNGNLLVYGQGPNIHSCIGPAYSAPSCFSMHLQCGDPLRSESAREPGTAIWRHVLYRNERVAATLTDYVLPDRHVFIREFDARQEIAFRICPNVQAHLFDKGQYFQPLGKAARTIQLRMPAGAAFFIGHTVPYETNMLIAAEGHAHVTIQGDQTIGLVLSGGPGRLIFGVGAWYPQVVAWMEEIVSDASPRWLEDSRAYWREFSAGRKRFDDIIPDGHALKGRMLDALDSVAVLIKSQQSSCGGVAAGHIYPMGYVRDMSGVMRGLLALGHVKEARKIIEFWIHKHAVHGNVLNADGMNNDGARLLFLNDEVEIPAYLIYECFFYYRHTGDLALLRTAIPMMKWAFAVQIGHLAAGMTEFSGDETYIAGAALPGTCIYHGSAESTLLFIESGELLLDFAETENIWEAGKLRQYREIVRNAKARYRDNFYTHGVYYANNPLREQIAGKPRFRHSFCQNYALHKNLDISQSLTWTERNDDDLYLCARCRDSNVTQGAKEPKRYVLNSVSLVPLYIGSGMFTRNEMERIVGMSAELFRKTGIVPSNVEGTRSLGYDYGMLLYNLVHLRHPLRDQLLEKMLDLLDPTGAWVEYYDGDAPHNCRCRPWESAINIEGVVAYIEGLASDLSARQARKG